MRHETAEFVAAPWIVLGPVQYAGILHVFGVALVYLVRPLLLVGAVGTHRRAWIAPGPVVGCVVGVKSRQMRQVASWRLRRY